jgi:hypothetical protein
MSENFDNINLEVIKRDESRQLKAVAIDMEEKGIDLFDSGHMYKDTAKPYVRKFGYQIMNDYLKYLAGQISTAVIVRQMDTDPQFDVNPAAENKPV